MNKLITFLLIILICISPILGALAGALGIKFLSFLGMQHVIAINCGFLTGTLTGMIFAIIPCGVLAHKGVEGTLWN